MVTVVLGLLCTMPSHAQGTASVAETGNLRLQSRDGLVLVTRSTVPVLEYHYAPDLPKPFVHPLNTPSGKPVTMASPPDHVHHRGLMFALGNVAFAGEEAQYVVFWGEQGAPDRLGHILPVPGSQIVEAQGGAGVSCVQLVEKEEWRRLSDQALMLTENRRLTVYDLADPRCNLLTWETELTPPERDAVLGPTEGRTVSYYGLGLRTPQDMDGGAVFDASGKEGEQAVNGDDARWCAYVSPNEPKRGFAMFDHPGNPRHPTGWFVMSAGFGYMTASLVSHQPYPLPMRQALRLRYGVCAFDGSPDAQQIEAWYRQWVELER